MVLEIEEFVDDGVLLLDCPGLLLQLVKLGLGLLLHLVDDGVLLINLLLQLLDDDDDFLLQVGNSDPFFLPSCLDYILYLLLEQECEEVGTAVEGLEQTEGVKEPQPQQTRLNQSEGVKEPQLPGEER